jgi:hypothetical protein
MKTAILALSLTLASISAFAGGDSRPAPPIKPQCQTTTTIDGASRTVCPSNASPTSTAVSSRPNEVPLVTDCPATLNVDMRLRSNEEVQFSGVTRQALADFRGVQYCQYRLTRAVSNRGAVAEIGLISLVPGSSVSGKLMINGQQSIFFAQTSASTGETSGVLAVGNSASDLYSSKANAIVSGKIEASQMTTRVSVLQM